MSQSVKLLARRLQNSFPKDYDLLFKYLLQNSSPPKKTSNVFGVLAITLFRQATIWPTIMNIHMILIRHFHARLCSVECSNVFECMHLFTFFHLVHICTGRVIYISCYRTSNSNTPKLFSINRILWKRGWPMRTTHIHTHTNTNTSNKVLVPL